MPPKKIIFHYLLLIRYWKDWQVILIIDFWIDIQGKIKQLLLQKDQEKTTFTCPYGNFAFRMMSFGLYNTPATFQWRLIAIFSNMVEKYIEIFIDDLGIPSMTAWIGYLSCCKGVKRIICAELGKISFHGKRRNCTGPQDFYTGYRGRQSQDTGD